MKIILLVIIFCQVKFAQQIGDSTYQVNIDNPVYTKGTGPIVLIDEGHNNFHTYSGRYKPFAEVLEMDGYNVQPFKDKFSAEKLTGSRILVIANALNELNTEEWSLPTPSAFTSEEIDQVAKWVKEGGNLFLIADHMPFPGAANELAQIFGFKMNNGFARDTTLARSPDLFTMKDKTLNINSVTEGRNELESVDSIYSFTGQAFQIPDDANPVLTLNSNFISLMPDTAWNFNDDTPKISVAGWQQGAVKKYGKGRVAVWGEAAMFSAQVANDRKFGFNSPYAKYNLQLLLNLIHWLDEKLD